jgi:hypothetical protein
MTTARRTALSPISRHNAKQLASRIWDRAIDGANLTNDEVAQQLYVDESRIRHQRSVVHADAVASLVDLVLADEELFQRTLGELMAERRNLHGELPPVHLPTMVREVMRAGSQFSVVGLDALANLEIEPTEMPALDERAADEERRIAQLRAALRAHGFGLAR